MLGTTFVNKMSKFALVFSYINNRSETYLNTNIIYEIIKIINDFE